MFYTFQTAAEFLFQSANNRVLDSEMDLAINGTNYYAQEFQSANNRVLDSEKRVCEIKCYRYIVVSIR